MDVVTYLGEVGIQYNLKEKINAYIECPWCGHSNLSINIYNGVWQCWSGDCRDENGKTRAGSFKTLMEKLKLDVPVSLSFRSPPKVDKTLTMEDALFIEACNANKVEVLEWAASRKLDGQFVLKMGVGWDKVQKAVVFPYRNEKGNLIGA